jgi:hypothetical protein
MRTSVPHYLPGQREVSRDYVVSKVRSPNSEGERATFERRSLEAPCWVNRKKKLVGGVFWPSSNGQRVVFPGASAVA